MLPSAPCHPNKKISCNYWTECKLISQRTKQTTVLKFIPWFYCRFIGICARDCWPKYMWHVHKNILLNVIKIYMNSL